jgi:hypothetical protein
MTTHAPDHELVRTYWAVLAVGAALAAGTLSFLGVSAASGVLVGTAMSWLSLVTLARAVRNLMGGAPRVSWGFLAVFKFAFLLVLTYWLLESGVVPPLGLALGFGALPLGIFASTLFMPAPGTHSTRKD